MVLRKIKFVFWLLFFAACLCSLLACDKKLGQQLLYNKARNLHDQGQLDKAIVIYKRILEMQGDHSEVNYDLGIAYADQGDVTNAKNQVEILRSSGRSDLAEVLAEVIRDSNSQRVRKRLQGEYDSEQKDK